MLNRVAGLCRFGLLHTARPVRVVRAAGYAGAAATTGRTGGAAIARSYAVSASSGAQTGAETSGGRLWTLIGVGTLAGVGVGGTLFLGAAPEEGMPDARKDLPFGQAHVMRVVDKYRDWENSQLEPYSDKLLPDKHPYPIQPKYTLVLDLTNTLITYISKDNVNVPVFRPGLRAFLQYLSEYYEIVVYTAQPGFTGGEILERMDPAFTTVTYRLFRDATRYVDGHYVKDLKSLNRDLSKVIVIDDDPMDCQLDPDNCIQVKPFRGEADDTVLNDLIPLLEMVVLSDIDDVREIIKRGRGTDMVQEFKERRLRAVMEAEERERKAKEEAAAVAERKGRGGLFGRWR